MANASKAKGDRWERALVQFFQDRGFSQAARLRQTGQHDQGDITIGSPYWAIEAKDDKGLSPFAMAKQAENEARNAGKPFGVAIRKSPRRPTEDATVIMSMGTFVRIVRYLETGEYG